MALFFTFISIFSYSQTLKPASFDRLRMVFESNKQLMLKAKTSEDRLEYSLRNEFLKRLIFRFDNYLNGDEKEFLIKQLDNIATIEASESRGLPALRKFVFNLSTALQNQAEKSENTGSFIEGYMKFSTISKPRDPSDYIKARSYSNGDEWYTAKSVRSDQVGEIVEKKLRYLERTHFNMNSPKH